MDVIFGSISAEERRANIEKQEKGESHRSSNDCAELTCLALAQDHGQPAKESSEKHEYTIDRV